MTNSSIKNSGRAMRSYPTALTVFLSLALASFVTIAHSADLPTATPQSQGFSKERLSRIRSVLDTEINANRMPGAV
ncbi:MAG: hypothetical protein ACKO2S_04930, partial [Burkholderiaceae bacterium]